MAFSIIPNTMKACVRGQTLLYSLCYNPLFYLTNSSARKKQNKPRKQWICICVCACDRVCVCASVGVPLCLCVAERVGSGYCQAVYLIEKPVLWSKEVGSISQRYASFLQLCIFPQTLRYTYVYVHWACMLSHKQCSLLSLVYQPHEFHTHRTFSMQSHFSVMALLMCSSYLTRQVYVDRTALNVGCFTRFTFQYIKKGTVLLVIM